MSKFYKGKATQVSPLRLLYPGLGTRIQEKGVQLGGVDVYTDEGSRNCVTWWTGKKWRT